MNHAAVITMRAAVEAISICPEMFEMDNWCKKTECGTTLCLAGHMLLFGQFAPKFDVDGYGDDFSKNGFNYPVAEIMNKTFGIETDNVETDWIFFVGSWPEDFETEYENGQRLSALRKAVDHYIAEHAPECCRTGSCAEKSAIPEAVTA